MQPFSLGRWRVDPSAREIGRGQESYRVSPKAMRVLCLLAEAPGEVVARRRILERVWPHVIVGDEVVTHAIAELRRCLDDHRRAPRYIETIQKSGYRLVAAVRHDARRGRASRSSGHAGQVADLRPVDLDAYLLYLDGADRFDRGGHENVEIAVEKFTLATELDPGSGLARAGLAKSLAFLYMYYEPSPDHLEKALDVGHQAVRAEPRLAMAHAAKGMALSTAGATKEARRSFGKAIRLGPDAFEAHYLFGRACFVEGEYAVAGAALERAAQLRGDDFHALALSAKAWRSLDNAVRSRKASARAARRLDAYLDSEPDDLRAICDMAGCLVELGDLDRAFDWADRVADVDDPMAYYLACSFSRAGEVSHALSCLERVVEAGWSHGDWLRRDPDLDNIRSERRYRRIENVLCGD